METGVEAILGGCRVHRFWKSPFLWTFTKPTKTVNPKHFSVNLNQLLQIWRGRRKGNLKRWYSWLNVIFRYKNLRTHSKRLLGTRQQSVVVHYLPPPGRPLSADILRSWLWENKIKVHFLQKYRCLAISTSFVVCKIFCRYLETSYLFTQCWQAIIVILRN